MGCDGYRDQWVLEAIAGFRERGLTVPQELFDLLRLTERAVPKDVVERAV